MAESRARLEWRCRRGTKELDLLLAAWLKSEFDGSRVDEQRAFVELLDWPDDALIRLLLGQSGSDNAEMDAIARKIRALPLSGP